VVVGLKRPVVRIERLTEPGLFGQQVAELELQFGVAGVFVLLWFC
jgi:hypothetical protein